MVIKFMFKQLWSDEGHGSRGYEIRQRLVAHDVLVALLKINDLLTENTNIRKSSTDTTSSDRWASRC